MGSSEDEKAGDAMGTSQTGIGGAQLVGRDGVGKGDRENWELTKVYAELVGEFSGMAKWNRETEKQRWPERQPRAPEA